MATALSLKYLLMAGSAAESPSNTMPGLGPKGLCIVVQRSPYAQLP
jgi:hypothetical protein